MIRNIFVVIVALALLAGGTWTYLNWRPVSSQPDLIATVPASSLGIIQFNAFDETRHNLLQNNLVWDEFTKVSIGQSANAFIHQLDTLFGDKNEDQASLEIPREILISLHLASPGKFNLYGCFHLNGRTNAESIKQRFSNQNITVSQLQESSEIHQVTLNGAVIFIAFSEGTCRFSTDKTLLAASTEQLTTGNSLLSNASFSATYETIGKHVGLNFIVNYRGLPSLLNPLFEQHALDEISQIRHAADWGALDLDLMPNIWAMNGFSNAVDSLPHSLQLFHGQEPVHHDMVAVLPEKTAFLYHLGLSNFNTYLENYKAYLKSNNKLKAYTAAIQDLNERFEINLEKQLLGWIENELAAVSLNPENYQNEENTFAVFRTNNAPYALKSLRQIARKVSTHSETALDSNAFRGFTIHKLGIDALGPLLGSPFDRITSNYYCAISNYIIFAKSDRALRMIINHFLAGKTMEKNLAFDRYSQWLASESNLLIYSNLPEAEALVRSYTGAPLETDSINLFRKFGTASLQLAYESPGMYYHNITLEHNPTHKRNTTSLWETSLKGAVTHKPVAVKNHYTNATELVVQDASNTLHLISNKGKILWSRSLENPIMGTIHQIDLYRNGKLQLIFNTENKLFVIDRLGRNVETFPKSLPSKASAPLGIADYADSKDYRFLIPTMRGNIINYNSNGEQVKGWKYDPDNGVVTHPIRHLAINRKDYLIALTESGKVLPLDRRGRVRIKLKKVLNVRPTDNYFIELGKNIRQTSIIVCDSVSNVQRLYFDDKLEKYTFNINPLYTFDYTDINNDGMRDLLFIHENELSGYTWSKEQVYNQSYDSLLVQSPVTFRTNNQLFFAAVVEGQPHVKISSRTGLPFGDFQLEGNSPFAVMDINQDGLYELIIGTDNGILHAYTLDQTQ